MSETSRKPQVEFYWDVGSTNTYFAFKLLRPIVTRHDAEIVFHPYNLGHVFRTKNYAVLEEAPEKLENRKRDLVRWADKYDLHFRFPTVFPIKTSRVLRGSIAMREWGLERDFIEAMLDAYWERDDHSIAEYAGMRPIIEKLGVDPTVFEERAESSAIRDALVESTNRGSRRGVFGVPSIFVGEELFWGKDRMEFIEDELGRVR